jgi:hypothetical protein
MRFGLKKTTKKKGLEKTKAKAKSIKKMLEKNIS